MPRSTSTGLLAASTFLDAGGGAGAAKVLEEDVLALHDAAGEGEDVGGEVVLVHLDPFGEHVDPVFVDALGEGMFVLHKLEEGPHVFDVKAVLVA